MSAEDLIRSLEAQRLLPDAVLRRLRQKIVGSTKPTSADALAKFLVEKGLLTREKVNLALEIAEDLPELEELPEVVPEKPRFSTPDVDFTAQPPKGLSAEEAAADERRASGYRPKKLQKNEFDTPLMLIGGGAIALLLLLGGGVGYLLFRESGEDLLRVAQEQFEQGSYTQAIPQYEQFLQNYPSHQSAGIAQVQLVLAKLRQAVEGAGAKERGLNVATEFLPEVADLEEFGEARSDLAAILPKLAEGLAAEAQKLADQGEATDLAQLAGKIKQTNEALELCVNNRYVPKTLRDETQLMQVRGVVERIELRRQGLQTLAETLAAMKAAVDNQDHRSAYAAHTSLVSKFPEYETNLNLIQAVKEAAKSEQQVIKFTKAEDQAETTDPVTSTAAELALANPWSRGAAKIEGVFVAPVAGALYGLRAADGELLWRRYVGVTPGVAPTTSLGPDVLVIDSRRQELQRLAGATGELRWRRPLPADAAAPVVAGDRVLIGDGAGQLVEISGETGGKIGAVEFAQPLRMPPVLAPDGRRLYVVGDEASLYALDASSLACAGVTYLGHRAGGIAVPPAVVLNRLVIAENTGAATSRLLVFTLTKTGALGKLLFEQPLDGAVTQPLLVAGRRLAAMTDRGALYLWDFGVGENEATVALLAKRDALGEGYAVRHAAVAGNQLWTADKQLLRFSLSPTDNQMRSLEVENDCLGDLFGSALEARGDVLLHVRQRKGRSGATVAATAVENGRLLWQTDVATPAVIPPAASVNPPGISVTTVDGQSYQITAEQLPAGVALPASQGVQGVPELVTFAARLTGGETVLGSVGSARTAIYAAGGPRARAIILPGEIASPVAATGNVWFAPLKLGQIYCYDNSGEPAANAYQPPLRPQFEAHWMPLATQALADRTLVVAVDPLDKLHVLAYQPGSPGKVTALAAVDIRHQEVITGAAITGKIAVLGAKNGRLLFTPLPEADKFVTVDFGSEIIWGPHVLGGQVLAAGAGGTLACYSAAAPKQPVWQVKLAGDDLLGAPLVAGNRWVIATQHGEILYLNPASGKTLATTDCGQTLGTGVTLFGKRLLTAGAEGTVLVVNQP